LTYAYEIWLRAGKELDMNDRLALRLGTALALCLAGQEAAAATTCGALPADPDPEADALSCMPLGPPSSDPDGADAAMAAGLYAPAWYARLCGEQPAFCGLLWELGTNPPIAGLAPRVVHDGDEASGDGHACLVGSAEAAAWLLDVGVTQDTCAEARGASLLVPIETGLLSNPWGDLDCFCWEYPMARICLGDAAY
jgi:hypothetical protein